MFCDTFIFFTLNPVLAVELFSLSPTAFYAPNPQDLRDFADSSPEFCQGPRCQDLPDGMKVGNFQRPYLWGAAARLQGCAHRRYKFPRAPTRFVFSHT